MKIIDEIIKEPVGGAHRNKEQALFSAKHVLIKYLDEFQKYSRKEILEQRKQKFLSIGKQKTFKVFSSEQEWITKYSFWSTAKQFFINYKKQIIIVSLVLSILGMFLFY